MRSLYTLFILFLLLTAGCKPDTATTTTTDPQSTEAAQVATDTSTDTPVLSPEGHDFSFLTHQLWLYNGAVAPKELGEEPFKDEWIDFEPDGSFVAGKGNRQTHQGTWAYNESARLLGIRPVDPAFKPSEWNVMLNNQMMVWVGTKAFGNQSTQIRLVRSDKRPE